MAEVDFSNAIIEPCILNDGNTWINPTVNANITLASLHNLFNVSGDSITSYFTPIRLVNEQKQLVYSYSGTFIASGTEFYLPVRVTGNNFTGWKVSNITFSAGDTFGFTINATLTCN